MEINTLKYRKTVELIKELFPEEKIPKNIISISLVKKKLGGGRSTDVQNYKWEKEITTDNSSAVWVLPSSPLFCGENVTLTF